ncbi:hypothetical protein HUB98_07230 [Paenibacillus barcinonensis]|uniref:Uncharacterized protein n=1 Tax=Paenibacillus barcinonensis TaxID=198119 RepID=A0A2V4UNQ9_PAEBA|nr:hypothetical protein [Paenibacillus barcinonensis]PYE41867.1 hypothetical protein DFQ00_1494 [Paenibacillus barcinonensis]QKS56157.1 hypothetical protein HUB98_07230 [Paenibacillus barcinonensis]
MIKIVSIQDGWTEIEATYTDEVKTYNLVTGYMTDDCQPYRVAQSAMIWLSSSGEIGEVECIFPRIVEESPCKSSGQIKKQEGFPILDITSEPASEVCIQFHEGDFTIWFAKDKMIDSQVQADSTTFLIAEANELVGIICRNVTKI